MLPFTHFMVGSYATFFTKKRNAITFFIAGFLGILPDFDFIFTMLGLVGHRTLTHTIFPSAVLVGLATYFIFESFWLGFFPVAMHCLMDLIDGGVSLFPGIKYGISLWPDMSFNQIIASSIVGTILLMILILILYRGKDEIKMP